MVIGVISDTHGLLRPEALAALRGCNPILHAGDIGSADVLEQLRRLAPVFAVRGNNDRERWAELLPETEVVDVQKFRLYLLHDLHTLDLDPAAAGFHAVISGHSHREKIEEKQGVLYFNPGSAGPRRFKLPVSIGRLTLSKRKLRGEIIELKV
jgi:putative phosphoesterase